MRSSYSYITLILLIAAAVAVFVGGSRLSHREELVRIARDREPLRLFAASMQEELNRLERLYESHLCRIARNTPVNDNIRIRMACSWLAGLRQVSVLTTQTDSSAAPLHVPMASGSGAEVVLPRPAFTGMERTGGLKVPFVVLPDEVRQADVYDFEWLDQPGGYPVFWYRRSGDLCIAMTVSRELVAESMNGWMRDWVKQRFVPLEAQAGGDRIVGPGNSVLASAGIGKEKTDRLPDFVIPMNQRFASWQLVSWDGWKTKQTNDVRTLAGSAALAILVALLGIGIFVQQRRALKLAEQRVSFINRVSHELRAPLTNILLNVDLAADDLDEREKDCMSRLGLVQEEGRRLSRLIDNVLTFSRHEQKRLAIHPRPCAPADVIGAVLEQFSAALERRSVRVELAGKIEHSCVFDPDAFSQILTNLVSNVEKYAADGGYLGIASKLEGGRLMVTVTDRGAGIPACEAEKIFLPFYRLHNEINEGSTGTGLGLSIARELAARMGGFLRLLSSEAGAVFELTIPVGSNEENRDGDA